MASIRKHQGMWEASVCVNRVRKSKRFETKRDAQAWALETERRMRDGGVKVAAMTFGQLMELYRTTETPKKKGKTFEDRRLRFYQADPIAEHLIERLRPSHFEDFVDRRQSQVSPRTGAMLTRGTIKRDLVTLSAVLSWAVKKGMLPSSPLSKFKPPKEEPHRERIASDEEIATICYVAGWDRESPPKNATQRVAAAFVFACLTGMRAGEILAVEREWVSGPVMRIPADATKTQTAREIALSDAALKVLRLVEACGLTPQVWGMSSSLREALWRKIRDKAGLGVVTDSQGRVIREALRFHDGRATFCTWAASPGPDGAPRMNVLALARQTGHRDLSMLQRYYRPSAAQLAGRLNS